MISLYKVLKKVGSSGFRQGLRSRGVNLFRVWGGLGFKGVEVLVV